MEAKKQTYSKISECGTFGFKPYGPHTEGGELWAWINTPDEMCVREDLWHPDDMEAIVDDFNEEMAWFVNSVLADIQEEVMA